MTPTSENTVTTETPVRPKTPKFALGQINYDSYCEKRDWKSKSGDPLPSFDTLATELQEAWEFSARATVLASGFVDQEFEIARQREMAAHTVTGLLEIIHTKGAPPFAVGRAIA
jgi:hypothetical protein